MPKRFLFNEFLSDFFDNLLYFGELHAPVMTEEGVPAFRPVLSFEEVDLTHHRTLIPPKKYLLPPEDHILTFSPPDGYQQTVAKEKHIILFGLHPCDLAGIAYLDKVFLELCADPWYAKKRQSLTLVGVSCEPDEFCFCTSVGISGPTGFDLFMEGCGDGFHLKCGTQKGEAILTRTRDLLGGRRLHPREERRASASDVPVPGDATPDTYGESPLWDDFAERCLSCGACSACCPTCYCYEVVERGRLDGKTAERLRRWDNCLFKAHGEVAGGINFRPSRQERLQYRFLHKYHGFGPLRGVSSCVGCGRCRAVCPVDIDLLKFFSDPGPSRVDAQ